jgi:signal transduction histidine kinase
MHAAAQPLAVLRASLDSNNVDRMSIEELRELALSSASEVERLCTLFSCLQQLVSTESVKPHLSEMPILPLLAHVADGVNLLFEDDGIILRSVVSDSCQPVLINRARTLQALSTVLLIAHAISHPRDTVELIASSSSSNSVRVVVRNLTSYVDAMNPEASLSMAFAEANIRSQEADFSWSLQPFSVQMELKGAPAVHYS